MPNAVLRPLEGIVPDGPAFRSSLAEPWFALDPGRPVAGRWIAIRYRAGLAQDPVRPLLRIERPAGPDYAILPGPVCGAAIWVGPIPADAGALALSPVATPGPFAFAVDDVRVIGRLQLLAGAVRRNPGLTLNAIGQRLRGRNVRARHFLASIWASTPVADYAAWREARSVPRLAEPVLAPRFGIVVCAAGLSGGRGKNSPPRHAEEARHAPSRSTHDGGACFETRPMGDPQHDEGGDSSFLSRSDGALARTLASLARQSAMPRHWVVDEGAALPAEALADSDWLGVLTAGDILSPGALSTCAAAVARDPQCTLLYADEDRIDAAGRHVDPVLKPDWSPRLQESTGYLDGLVMVRTAGLPPLPDDGARLADRLIRTALAVPAPRVGHVRRILLHRPSDHLTAPPPSRVPAAPRDPAPLVSAVIPNRDSLALLRVCVDGFRQRTAYPHRELVIVDNGSVDPATRAYYGTLVADPAVMILDRPGPFNFSHLTNEGASVAKGAAILMLNNDIEVIAPDWLDRMVAELDPPDVAAVGAKLLYPSGRVQHSGVAIGLGGAAGHVYRGRADRAGSWAARLSAPHEVSAVTGACLLVRRTCYEAVGRLDEAAFPVSFNDIDLCLKLRREGWRVILTPGAVLYHHESASRGRDIGPKQVRAAREAAAFAARWRSAMRDDPYFHPGLSLLRFDVELG